MPVAVTAPPAPGPSWTPPPPPAPPATAAYQAPPSAQYPDPDDVPAPPGRLLPQWRKGTWIILAFNLLMLIWVATGAATVTESPADCGVLSQADCDAAGDVGTAIGVGILITLWALGNIILGVIWLVTNGGKRQCPACGTGAKKGVIVCRYCGHDFRRLAV